MGPSFYVLIQSSLSLCCVLISKSHRIQGVQIPSDLKASNPVKIATSKSRQISRHPNHVNISMADSDSASALREVAATIRALAATIREPLLAVTSALSQAEATLASLDVQVVTKQVVLPTEPEALPAVSSTSRVGNDSHRSPLLASMDQSATLSGLDRSAPSSFVLPSEVSSELPRSPKSPSGQTTGRRLSQALCGRGSKFDKIFRIN